MAVLYYITANIKAQQKGRSESAPTFFSFVGFLADEEHPYAFVVLVENGGGGLYAAGPVANALLQAAVRSE